MSTRHALVASVILLIQAGFYYGFSTTEVIPSTPPWAQFPLEIDEWRTTEDRALSPEIAERLRPDDFIDRVYESSKSGKSVNFSVVYFKSRRTGNSPHSPKACMPGAGWQSVSATEGAITPAGGGPPIAVNWYEVERNGVRVLVLYWYQQERRTFVSEIVAQLYALPGLLTHGRTDVAFIRVIAPVKRGEFEEVRKLVNSFAELTYPLVLRQVL